LSTSQIDPSRVEAETDAASEIVVDGPFDLHDVLRPHLHGHGDPTMRLGASEAWRAVRTPDGPATLRLAIVGQGRVRAQAWGPGSGWAVEHARRLIGADDDPVGALESIAAPIQTSRLIRDLVRRRPTLLRIGRTDRVMEALVPAILEQKVTGDEARRAWRYLVREYGEPAPGPGAAMRLRVPPSPAKLAALPYFAFHPGGVEQRRADTVRRVSARAAWVEEVASLPTSEAYERLTSLAGIGPWTAAEVTFRALGDADAVSVGDFHLPHLVSWTLAGERRGTDERMLELLAPFEPHRARIVRLIETSGAAPSRRGPRMVARHIERH